GRCRSPGRRELTALSTLAALCPVWLDDFGRGRTSFPLLERFRFDCVKVDKDYFWDKENDPALPGLLQSIHTLTGHVIVEGIETEKQKRLITSAGDIIGQGRYWKE
ncbi:EAL domain-containing protein, partial [Pseudomonas aeruginosa]|nr:EAL domain-containing protein [Pseudomonas aeruginosa]